MRNNFGFSAKITGWLFIIAAVSSIIGLKLYELILVDSNFLTAALNYNTQIIGGASFELIMVASASAT